MTGKRYETIDTVRRELKCGRNRAYEVVHESGAAIRLGPGARAALRADMDVLENYLEKKRMELWATNNRTAATGVGPKGFADRAFAMLSLRPL